MTHITSSRGGCVVTGVAGFVGSHLAQALLERGFEVVGVDDLSSGYLHNMDEFHDSDRFHFYEKSITEPGLLAGIHARHPELHAVFHLAAVVSVPYSLDYPEKTLAVNWEATLALHSEARVLGVGTFLLPGSAAEYGDTEIVPVREEDATDQTVRLSPYGETKYRATRLIVDSGYGVSLRFFNIYGPRQDPTSQYSGVISRFIDRALAGKDLTVFGDGGQFRDFLYVGDAVRAFLYAAGIEGPSGTPVQGVFNVGTGEKTSVLDLAEYIRKLGGDVGLRFGPERGGDIRKSLADPSHFMDVAAWRPKMTLEEGLKATWEWAVARNSQ